MLELDLKAGSVAFVRLSMTVSFAALVLESVPSLRVVDPSEGREGVMAAKLAITN